MFEDDAGNTSSLRIITTTVIAMFMITWMTVSLTKMEMQPLDFGDAAFVGVVIGGKVTQKMFEKKGDK
jgi:hypothetical protein